MTIDPVTTGGSGLVERAKNILMTPQAEWDRISTETPTLQSMLIGYVLPLAAIAAVAGLIWPLLIGGALFAGAAVVGILVGAIVNLALVCAFVALWGFVINALAPTFGSASNATRAHQLSVYSATAIFVAGIGAIIPFLLPLVMLAGVIYYYVLIYIGLPRLMKTPEEKRMPYVLTLLGIGVVAGIVLWFVYTTFLMSLFLGISRPAYTFGERQAPQQQSEVTLPGGGNVDLGELQRQAEAYANNGEMQAIDPARLQQQLPQSLPGGFQLTSQSSGSAMGTAQAEGVYSNGGAELRVTVVHMGAMGAIAGMAQSMNVQENRQDADGFARTQTVDGRVYTEEQSNSSRSASYGVIGRGIAVQAQGSNGVTLDQARAAVETINVQRLEREFGA